MWKFSKHALLRLEERGYTLETILQILENDVFSIIVSSPREETVDLHFGKVADAFLLVVVDRFSKTVITVRPMWRNEKKVFLEESENE